MVPFYRNFNSILTHYCLTGTFLPAADEKASSRKNYERKNSGSNGLKKMEIYNFFNPLLPDGKLFFQQCQHFDLNLRRDHQKKFHMNVATMSRNTKRAYLRLCPDKRRKKEFCP